MQENSGKKYGSSIGVIYLIISALLWGSEYVVAKDVFNVMPANWSNAIRTFFYIHHSSSVMEKTV